MSPFADQFGPIPGEKGLRYLPNFDRIRHASETNGTPALLIAESPAQAPETKCKSRNALYKARKR